MPFLTCRDPSAWIFELSFTMLVYAGVSFLSRCYFFFPCRKDLLVLTDILITRSRYRPWEKSFAALRGRLLNAKMLGVSALLHKLMLICELRCSTLYGSSTIFFHGTYTRCNSICLRTSDSRSLLLISKRTTRKHRPRFTF